MYERRKIRQDNEKAGWRKQEGKGGEEMKKVG